MRVVNYRAGRGRATHTAKRNLDELVMLTQAAVTITNVERWAQERTLEIAAERGGTYESVVPPDVRVSAKRLQYEVSVVDEFLRLAAHSFALNGSEAVWERPFRTGVRGRPPTIDVALFNARRREESRIEFGYYSKAKLRDDARKLADLPVEGGLRVTNYLILWRLRSSPLYKNSVQWRDECLADAAEVSDGRCSVELRVASSQHVFVAKPNDDGVVDVGLFSVHRPGAEEVDETEDL